MAAFGRTAEALCGFRVPLIAKGCGDAASETEEDRSVDPDVSINPPSGSVLEHEFSLGLQPNIMQGVWVIPVALTCATSTANVIPDFCMEISAASGGFL